MTNKTCYISDVPLSPNNISKEHIIPNALGGFLKSTNLVTAHINNTLFAEIDAILVDHLELAQLIKFTRDRSTQPNIIGTSENGEKYKVNAEGLGILLPKKPEEIIDENGKRMIKIPFSQKLEYLKSFKKKNPELSDEQLEKKIKLVNEEVTQFLSFKHNLNIFLTPAPFRGIAKIATNFAIFHDIEKMHFLGFIDFIKGDIEALKRIQLGYFYPKSLLEYNFDPLELSHILYLKGCPKRGVLYCYIELFNTHCFIVNLSYHYNGPEIDKNYIWDVKKATQLYKSISMNLDYPFLSSRKYMFEDTSEGDYKERLLRIAEICNFNLVGRPIQ